MGMRVVVPPVAWAATGTVRQWHRDDGDWVNQGMALCTLQMGSTTHAVTAFDSGFLRLPKNRLKVGAAVRRGDLLGWIVAPGEHADRLSKGIPPEPARVPRLTDVDARWLQIAARTNPQRRRISPRARRAALDAGINWERLQGSGQDGRINRHDIEAAVLLRPATAVHAEAQHLAVTFTIQLTVAESDVMPAIDQLLLSAVQAIARHLTGNKRVSLGYVQSDDLRFSSMGLEPSIVLRNIAEARSGAAERSPDPEAQWLILDAASAGLESIRMPLPAACRGALFVGRDGQKLRVSLIADRRRLTMRDVLELVAQIRSGARPSH